MAKGKVKWFSNQKGYGFIEAEDGEDVFLHHTGFKNGDVPNLSPGDRVVFEKESGEKGPRANQVVPESQI